MNFKKNVLLAMILMLMHNLTFSQDSINSKDLNKYQISIDLQQFFSEGYPNKVIFKKYRIKDAEIKGAFRLGLRGFYQNRKYESSTDGGLNYELSEDRDQINFGLSFGYQRIHNIKSVKLYYGLDVGGIVSKINVLPEQGGDSDFFRFEFNPFVGLELPISRHFSSSFELGLVNMYYQDEYNNSNLSPDNLTKVTNYMSELSIPYTLSINYNF